MEPKTDIVEPTPVVEAPSQEPVKEELEKLEAKPKRTKLETLIYNRDRLARDIEEEKKKRGIDDEEGDERPLTVGEFRRLQIDDSQATAKTLAEDIEDESERKLVLYHLSNTIKPSGDAKTDLAVAKSLVDAVKNRQLAEEALRKVDPKRHVSGASAPAKEVKDEELTAEEIQVQKWTGVSKEQIIAARPK